MKTTLVGFATENFSLAREELTRSALRHGVDEVRIWDLATLRSTEFWRKHESMFALPRGVGYWLWKPYIIADALERLEEGAPLIYSDVGVQFVSSLAPVVDLCKQAGGILVFDGRGHYVGFAHRDRVRTWTKRDCFILLGCDEPAYHEAPMLEAGFLVLINSARTRQFVAEWLEACTDPRVLTDRPNELGQENLPGCVGHLYDQSVLSLLAKKHGLRAFRSPSQFGNHCKPEELRVAGEWVRRPYGSQGIDHDSPYPTLLVHHRMRNLSLEPIQRILVERLGNRLPLELRTGSAIFLDLMLQLLRLWTPPARVLLFGPDAQRTVVRACATLADTRLVLWLEGATPETYIPELRELLSRPAPNGNQVELITQPTTDPTTWSQLLAQGIDVIISSLPPAEVPLPQALLREWSTRPFLGVWDPVDDTGEQFQAVASHIMRQAGKDLAAAYGLVASPFSDEARTAGYVGRFP